MKALNERARDRRIELMNCGHTFESIMEHTKKPRGLILDVEAGNVPESSKNKAGAYLDMIGAEYTATELNELCEPASTRKTKEEIKAVIERGSRLMPALDSDPIKPKHYRKGEIDLYESWYRTYPFNEFKAGMQMIAERYMKRDKENPVQDIEKGIYTLKRLKEYIEMEGDNVS